MSLLKTVEQDAETALAAIANFVDDTVWPELKQFLSVFDPLEAKALLSDLLGAIPTATTAGPEAAAVQVVAQIGPQTVANAKAAAASLDQATGTN